MTQLALITMATDFGSFIVKSVDGEPEFDPEVLGVYATGASLDCCRGWLPGYRLIGDHLMLKSLEVYAYPDELPLIHSIRPKQLGTFFCRYEELNMPFQLTGSILILDDETAGWRWGPNVFNVDTIFPSYKLHFDSGILKQTENLCFMVRAGEKFPGDCIENGRIFMDDPTPFDSPNSESKAEAAAFIAYWSSYLPPPGHPKKGSRGSRWAKQRHVRYFESSEPKPAVIPSDSWE